MVDFLLTPFFDPAMQRALIAALLTSGLCAIVGCYVVLRGIAFLGDALAHAILPGVAVAFLLGGDVFIGALLMSVLAAIGIARLSGGGRVREDTAIGIVFSGALALGVALISSAPAHHEELEHILFGDVLSVAGRDLALMAGVGAVVLATVALLYKEFLIFTFDPTFAATLTLRVPVNALRYALMLLLAVTVVVSLKTVGAGLAAAMLITPAATASLLTRRLARMMLLAAALGGLSALIGLYAAYYLRVAAGASIVLACTLLFVLALIFSPRDGLLARRQAQRAP